MIDLVEVFNSTVLDSTPVPYLQYLFRITVSVQKPEINVAAWWRTTYGGGYEINETKQLVSSFWDAVVEYNEKESLEDCIGEEKSFYFDVGNDPQFLYVHYDHDLFPIDDNTQADIGYGQGYSSGEGVYLNDIYYEPRIKETIPFKVSVDPISIGRFKVLSGSVKLDNSDGEFDNGSSWYGAKVKGYKYDLTNTPIQTYFGNVENESFSFEDYGITIKDSREFDDVKIVLDKWDTTWLSSGHSKIGKPIPIGFGEILGVEGVNVINPTAGYKKFKGVSECLTVDAAYVEDDDVWTSVTVYNSSMDGTFELANGDVLDADSKLLPVKVDYTCDYENLADLIVYLNTTYKGIAYDSTNYNLDLWEVERFAFSECGILIDKDKNLLKIIAELQAGQKWPFFYWRNREGKRSIKIDNPNRTPRYDILAEDIQNFDRPDERDNTQFATSVEVLYSYDHKDKTYLSYVNDTYRDSVFRTFRKYQDKKGDDGLKTLITSEADAEDLSYIRMEDWQTVHDTFTIWVRRASFPDIEILDTLNVDLAIPEDLRLSGTGRTYFGDQRVKVIGVSYIDNDFIELEVRTQAFSVVIADIGGYMSTVVVNHTRITTDTTLPTTENHAHLVYNDAATSKDVTYGGSTKTLQADETGFFLNDGTDFHLLAVWDDTGVNVVTQAWVTAQGYLTSGVPVTGTIVQYAGATAPTDWLICEGETIGDASSGADYAGAEYEDLFDLLNAARWGNPGGATWASHDTVLLPDFRNVTVYGANSSTRAVGGRTQDAMALGATHADQHEQLTGELMNGTDVGLNKNDASLSGVFSAGSDKANGAEQSATNEYSIAFDSAGSPGANAGSTTKAAGLAATFIIKI